MERAHTNPLDANDKLIQTRPHLRNTITTRKRQFVMRKVKSTIRSRIFFGAYCSGWPYASSGDYLLRDNHDLGVTDTFLSVCASKVMVHCIGTCDTQLWHMILYLWFSYQPVDHELSRNLLVDHSRRQVGHPWNRLLAYTTHTYANQHNKQSSIPAI